MAIVAERTAFRQPAAEGRALQLPRFTITLPGLMPAPRHTPSDATYAELYRRALREKAEREAHAHSPYISLREWAAGENLEWITLPAFEAHCDEQGREAAERVFRQSASEVCAELGYTFCPDCHQMVNGLHGCGVAEAA